MGFCSSLLKFRASAQRIWPRIVGIEIRFIIGLTPQRQRGTGPLRAHT